ncbi:toxin co-regulated pilus biosynthesis Q family protein [Serratia fonticola]|uniref:toxin co-regulated pilus biosynthesis Q family protein n=1 Tax=Serratia fonticola TaxID=47917 RepID=UPI0015C69125|nr:toxin co-regulated pilus biosynthesis Q family protein [Serratia fonticola]NYA16304.1 TcpQ domain-containing protein [Serratia fonticola]
MKIFLPVALAPVVLSGCAISTPAPPRVPAQEFVTSLIQEQIPIIQQAQADLAQASRIRLKPAPATRESVPVAATLSHRRPDTIQPKALAGQPVPTLQAIRYLGERPASLALARAGNATTLRQAMRQITPAGWQVSFSQELKPDARISLQWRGNDQWPFVMDEVLQQQGKVGLIDWQAQRISVAAKSVEFTPGAVAAKTPNTVSVSPSTTPAITNKKDAVSSGRNPFGGSQSTTTSTPAAAVKPTASVTLPKTIIKPKVWRIEAGSTLKDTLFSWAAAEKCSTPGVANWTVAWLTSANYRIDAPLQFDGSFRDALNSLFTLYGTAQVPLYAGVRQVQCVISVDDKEIH